MRSLKVYSIEDFKIEIDPDYVLKRLGKHRHSEIGKWKEKVLNKIEEAIPFIGPIISYTEMGVSKRTEEGIELEGFLIKSKNLAKRFSRVQKVTLFLATIGQGLTTLIENDEREISDSVIFDAIGSEAVESTVRWFHKNLFLRAKKKGFKITGRYSPGYGDFSIECQKWFVKNLRGDKMGIRITDNYMLVPEKSITGVIGWRTS